MSGAEAALIGFTIAGMVVLIMLALITARISHDPGFINRIRRPRGGRTFHRTQLANMLEPVPCPNCSGGIQWLHPENGWGKIPRHMLYRRWNTVEQDYDCRDAIYANLRKCPHCAAWGSISRFRNTGQESAP